MDKVIVAVVVVFFVAVAALILKALSRVDVQGQTPVVPGPPSDPSLNRTDDPVRTPEEQAALEETAKGASGYGK
jgi:hypothetical protein